MHLYIIRHGQSHVNVATDWAALPSMDTSLTEKGHKQAEALRDWMKTNTVKADALYCSTMLRAMETAGYVSEALNLPPTPDDRLREIGNSYTNAQAVEEENLPRSYAKPTSFHRPFAPRTQDFEHAETWLHFRIRLGQFVDMLIDNHMDQTVYVVAHGGVIAAMFSNVFNVGPYHRCEVHSDNTSWAHFHYKTVDSPWSLYAHNRVDHLLGTNLI